VLRRAALAASIIALICCAAAWRCEVTASILHEKLPPETFRVFGMCRVPIFKTGKKECLSRPVHYGIGLGFGHLQLKRVFGGKGAVDAIDENYSGSGNSIALWHRFRKSLPNLNSEPDALYRKGASTSISKVPSQSEGDESVIVRGTVEALNTDVHKIDIRLLSSGCDFRQNLLRLGGFNIGIGASLDRLRLLRNCFSLRFGFLHLLPNGIQLTDYSVGLPFRLAGQFRQIADRAFDVTRVACGTIGGNGNEEHCDPDNAINKINNSNFAPKRLIGWGFILFGGAVANVGWLWLIAAARRDLTLHQAGWRGALAMCLCGLGMILIWQGVSLAFAI
jgi:hypothetical protein